jgi:hypothetical protein
MKYFIFIPFSILLSLHPSMSKHPQPVFFPESAGPSFTAQRNTPKQLGQITDLHLLALFKNLPMFCFKKICIQIPKAENASARMPLDGREDCKKCSSPPASVRSCLPIA